MARGNVGIGVGSNRHGLIIRKLSALKQTRDVIRILNGNLAAVLLTSAVTVGEEALQIEFADALLGSWAPTIAICQAKNELKFTISESNTTAQIALAGCCGS
jgi:hypothetical protein